MNSLSLVTPAIPPITIEEAKQHLRVDFDDDDVLIETYVKAATAYAESFMGRSLGDQTWDYTIDAYPADGVLELPRPPLLEVVQFDDGNSPSFDDYEVDLAGSRIYLPVGGTWPTSTLSANVARIRFRAGYVDLSASPVVGEVPDDIRNAILLIVGSLYAYRETMVIGQAPMVLPWSAEQLMRRHRVELSLA